MIATLFDCDADVDIRDYSGRKPKHYITDRLTSVWIQEKLGKKVIPSVLVSSEEALSKGFRNEGSFFLETKSQSSSLGSGLDQLDQEPNALRTPRHKASRSSSFVQACRNVTGRFTGKKSPKLDIPETTGFQYHRTGRARSAPDINDITSWSPRVVHVLP